MIINAQIVQGNNKYSLSGKVDLMLRRLFFIAVLIIFHTFVVVGAEALTFTDDVNYWPGWSNGTGDDSQDSLAIPQFTGGEIIVTGNLLQSISVDQTADTNYWKVIAPGDLFIGTVDGSGDFVWSYYVDLTSWTTAGTRNPDPAAGNYPVYSINAYLNDGVNYSMSGTDNAGGWSGYLVRDNHPVAYGGTNGTYIGDVGFSGWGSTADSLYAFDFTGLAGGGLTLDDTYIIGWTVNCANDVIFYEGAGGGGGDVPIPEPLSIILLGTGLAGLAGARKRAIGNKI